MAYDTNSTARVIAIADQILELDNNNPDALILKADRIKDNHKKIELLKRALNSLNVRKDYNDRELLLFQANEGLALIYFVMNKFHESLKYCIDAAEILNGSEDISDDISDEKGYFRTVYYRVMIELHEWNRILSETMRDAEHNTSWAYSRLIAAFMLNPGEHGHVCANMFWDLLRISPEVPFYMLGMFEEPDDDADSEAGEDFEFALMYYDTLKISEEFNIWFQKGTILFGLLTNRFDSREHDYMLDALDSLGGYEDYDRISGMIIESDDEAVIEMLAANRCMTE